uniref:NADH-ubiquinone oxidoreductase chain 1 n=1 Tax=Terebratalia transversa TaxID=34513 RepID=Q953X2_TERTR|nr:NADH dehydrogenase subunit 1 [Terebratalia transversa]AAK95504.1 NADH dehydrogenase subunit 1 [Terebratalia transversa]
MVSVTYTLFTLVPILLSMAFFTLLERKILGYAQNRKGPNKVGVGGWLQPILDAVKLLSKDLVSPSRSSKVGFFFAPVAMILLSLIFWLNYWSAFSFSYLSKGVLYFMCVSSLSVYPVFMSGWASNSKYALLGAIRSVAQTISYEISMVLIILVPLCLVGGFDMNLMPGFFWVGVLFPYMVLPWAVTVLAETNRAPFDFAEGESELVSGYNVEYGGVPFTLIFMGEYISILFLSLMTAVLFMGTGMVWVKTLGVAVVFVLVRSALPRLRYDLIMGLTWKCYLPVVLSLMVPLIVLMKCFGG